MDRQEAAEVEGSLREMLLQNNLNWVLEQVDEAIRGGKLEQKEATTLKEYSREEAAFDFGSEQPFATKGKAKLTAIEEYSAIDRVQLLIEATNQAVAESTIMASEAMQRLRYAHNEDEPSNIKFIAEDGTEERSADIARISERRPAADRLSELLTRLGNLVNDQ